MPPRRSRASKRTRKTSPDNVNEDRGNRRSSRVQHKVVAIASTAATATKATSKPERNNKRKRSATPAQNRHACACPASPALGTSDEAPVTALQKRRKEVTEAVQRATQEAASAVPVTAEARLLELRTWLREARNTNTTRTYDSAIRQFRQWASSIENQRRTPTDQVNCDRPSDLDVALYVQYLVQVRRGSRAIVNGALAAISDHIRYERTTAYDPCVSSLVQRTRDTLLSTARVATQKKELDSASLTRIVQTIDAATHADEWTRHRDAAMLTLAYAALLRGSEVVRMRVNHVKLSNSGTEAEGTNVNTRPKKKQRRSQKEKQTIATPSKAEHQLMEVYVDPLSKNDTERTGHSRLIGAQGTKTCAVARMETWLRFRSLRASHVAGGEPDPLFPTQSGSAMHADTPRGRLLVWMTEAKFEKIENYGFHSLRAGGATDAARAGASERDIQRHGNWKSNIVQTYIRSNVEDRLRVSEAQGRAATATNGI